MREPQRKDEISLSVRVRKSCIYMDNQQPSLEQRKVHRLGIAVGTSVPKREVPKDIVNSHVKA